MRKLIEAVEIIEAGEKTVVDILQYFSNKKVGGNIKDGYIAKINVEGRGDEWVTRISRSPRQRGDRSYVKFSVNDWELSEQSLLKIQIFKLIQVV